MTRPGPGVTPGAAVIDGVDVDAVAEAKLAKALERRHLRIDHLTGLDPNVKLDLDSFERPERIGAHLDVPALGVVTAPEGATRLEQVDHGVGQHKDGDDQHDQGLGDGSQGGSDDQQR